MHSTYQQYLSGLGDAEAAILSTDGSAGDGADGGAGDPSVASGGNASNAGTAPGGAGASGGPGWDTVLATAASALPVIATKAADAYRTYEEAHAGIPHASGGAPGPGPSHPASSRPWYESPGFLIVAGLGLGIVVVIATRRK